MVIYIQTLTEREILMSEIQVIHEQAVFGHTLRVYGTEENPLFLAKEVAEWIDYSKGNVWKMTNSVDEDEKLVLPFVVAGQKRETTFLTEYGLYEVLMQSRKPIAKQFKKQVKQILKTIRQTGGYVSDSDRILQTYFSGASDEHKIMIKGFMETIEEKQKELEESKKQIDELTPKAEKFERFLSTESSYTVSQVCDHLKAEGYNTKRFPQIRSAIGLNRFLESKGIQYRVG